MLMLSRLFLLLTVLALLPLGSFAAKFGTGPRHVAVISAQLDEAAVAATAREKTFASAQSRCKGPALPGSPCNPALAVWPTEVSLAFSAPATTVHPTAWPPRIGLKPVLPLGPPRLV
ncbi:MAG: hypothetical protein V4586_20360 [Pseudomonadota bacterium]